MNNIRRVSFKVFLTEFPDLRAPKEYTPEYIQELFFGHSIPEKSPAPDHPIIGSTLYQYFASQTDFNLIIEGHVEDWVRSRIKIVDIPAIDSGENFTEPFAAGVAETLIAHGFTSKNYPDPKDLKKAVYSLPGGKLADQLVFLSPTFLNDGGGGERRFKGMKNILENTSKNDRDHKYIRNTRKKWITLWDRNWNNLIDPTDDGHKATDRFFIASILNAKNYWKVTKDSNGFWDENAKLPKASDLRLTATSVLVHEYGHLILNLPDLYNQHYTNWGVFALMSSSPNTYYPPILSSYSRNLSGLLKFTEKEIDDEMFALHPLETNNEAVRVLNGVPGSDFYIALENRDELHYGTNPSRPPTSNGRMLLAYHLDRYGRHYHSYKPEDERVRKITNVIRKSKNYGEAWKSGQKITGSPADKINRDYFSTTRNPLGELWWEINKIEEKDGSLLISKETAAIDLVNEYHTAKWFGMDLFGSFFFGKKEILKPDKSGGKKGHVMMVSSTPKIKNKVWGKSLYLHPLWDKNSAVRGTYDLSKINNNSFRLYAEIAIPDEVTGTDGVTVIFKTENEATSYKLLLHPRRGKSRMLSVDFPPAKKFTIEIQSGGSAHKDWVYLKNAWLVPTPPVIFDCVKNSGSAAWKTGAGKLIFNERNKSKGEISYREVEKLHDGKMHRACLFTHPNWSDDGYIEGVWKNIDVPARGAYLRASIGWHHGRRVTDDGVKISIFTKKSSSTRWELLIKGVDLRLYENNSIDPFKKNDLIHLALAIPHNNRKAKHDIKIRIDASIDSNGSAAQDWVVWRSLSLTAA